MPGPYVIPVEGTKLSYSATSDGTYTDIGAILAITPAAPKATAVKTTGLADTTQTFRAGLQPDPGEFSFRLKYDPNDTTHALLVGLPFDPANNNKWYKITYPDSFTTHATDKFQAIITGLKPQTAEDEKNHEMEFTLQITSAITRTAGS